MAEPDWLNALTLWQCIGCGSMGNAETCTGACAFKKLLLVGAEDHAVLLDHFLTLEERRDALADFARALAAATETEDGFAQKSEELRLQARGLLRGALEDSAPLSPVPPEDRFETWRCESCGQVEAQHECLGVCIRRNGDYVAGADHDALGARIESLRGEMQELASLARRVGWASPRPGRLEATRAAWGQEARRLMPAA
jgi:hypothetical protein